MFFVVHITWCICIAKYAGENRENIAFRLCSIDLDVIHSLPLVGFLCVLVEGASEHNLKEHFFYGRSKGLQG